MIAANWNVFEAEAFLLDRFHQTSIHRPELIEFIWFIISGEREEMHLLKIFFFKFESNFPLTIHEAEKQLLVIFLLHL